MANNTPETFKTQIEKGEDEYLRDFTGIYAGSYLVTNRKVYQINLSKQGIEVVEVKLYNLPSFNGELEVIKLISNGINTLDMYVHLGPLPLVLRFFPDPEKSCLRLIDYRMPTQSEHDAPSQCRIHQSERPEGTPYYLNHGEFELDENEGKINLTFTI